MTFITQQLLTPYNTMGVNTYANTFMTLNHERDIDKVIQWRKNNHKPTLILGSGSNILFTQDYDGLILHVALQGKQLIKETSEHYYIEAMAGENWHNFVRWTLTQGYAGLENLSLIPGTVGAAPVQNIGAYGVELTNVFSQLTAVDLTSGKTITLNRDECQFDYRYSLFKTPEYQDYLITRVVFKLAKQPVWQLSYGGVQEALGNRPINATSISDAIISIRQSKLPDPSVLGNCGSFFKNPIITHQQWQALKAQHPNLPGFAYPADETKTKTSAAWLIDQCNWKGKRYNDAGVYDKHALILVNHDKASGKEVWQLAQAIIDSVKARFAITLEPEPIVL